MKLPLDANISWRLVAKLKVHFAGCFHIDHIGLLAPVKDTEIWNYALENDMMIITNDEDFLNLADHKGFPPKVVLLRTGYQSSTYIQDIIAKHIADIEALSQSDEYGFLEIF